MDPLLEKHLLSRLLRSSMYFGHANNTNGLIGLARDYRDVRRQSVWKMMFVPFQLEEHHIC